MDNNMQTPKRGINSNVIYLGIIALLVVAGIYLFMSKNKAENAFEETSNQLVSEKTNKEAVEQEYNAALARLDEMKGESVQMDSLLQVSNDEVSALKEKIKSILDDKNATANDLKKANEMIAQLKSKMDDFQKTITALKQENIQLTEDKKQLIDDKEQITQERENLKEEKKQVEKVLEKTVETASILHASNIRLEAINMKKNLLGKEKEKETVKAKKVDLIRIKYDLDVNRVSENGDKILYVCVYKPNGTVATNGGRFKLENNTEKGYTAAKTVAYKQGEQINGITLDWKPLDAFETGKYKVEIYHMGHKIGAETVELK